MSDFEVFASGLGFTEGPVALADGSLWVTSITHGRLYHLDAGGTVIETVDTGGGPNGLAIDAEGALYVAQNGGIWGGQPGATPGIQRIRNGRADMIVTGVGAPNDLCFGPDGRLYFTDPRAECDPGDWETAMPGRLYACRRDGAELEMLHEGLRFINGLAFDPTGHVLYLAETAKPHRIFRAALTEAGLGVLEEFILLEGGFPDGLAVGADGSVWVAATMDDAVHVYDPQGRLLAKKRGGPGALPTNLCFGKSGPPVLYVTASGRGEVLRTTSAIAGVALYG